MRFPYRFSAVVSLLLALGFAPAIDAQEGSLAGVVTNELGQPVAQAQITILGGRHAFATKSGQTRSWWWKGAKRAV